MRQFIYNVSASIAENYSPKAPFIRNDKAQFVLINNFKSVLQYSNLLFQRFGFSKASIKLLMKLIIRRNALYIVTYQNEITSDGLLSFGVCNHYKINSNDVVVGPVNTSHNHQGKGFATFGLISCVNSLRQVSPLQPITRETQASLYNPKLNETPL